MAVFVCLLLAAAALSARWLWHLWRHPFGNCRWCNGSGRNKGSMRGRYGLCPHCKGGQRVRAGAGLVHSGLRKSARR